MTYTPQELERARQYRIKNAELIRKKQRERYAANPDKLNAISRKWRKRRLANDPDYYKRHHQKHRDYYIEYNRQNRSRISAHRRFKDSGFTQEYYDAQIAAQKGLCAICQIKLNGSAHADHDHETKRTRGVLCEKCNRGLGHFNDSIEILSAAVQYLGSWKVL